MKSLIFILVSLLSVELPPQTVAAANRNVIPGMLVRAKVTKSTDVANRQVEFQLRVEHVYVGPPEAEGATFSKVTSKSGEGTGVIYPVPKLEEEGIWPLLLSKGGALEMDYGFQYLLDGVVLPSRKGVDARYEQVRMLAERIEEIVNAPKDERVKMSQECMKDATAEVASWAIYYYAGTGGAGARESIRKLATDESLAVLVQINIDEALFAIDPEWRDSKERFEMFNRWVTKDYSDDPHVGYIRGRLDIASQHGGLTAATLLVLLNRAFEAKTLPPATLRECGWLVGTITMRQQTTYADLAKQISESKSHDMRLACAQALRDHLYLGEGQLSELKQIVKDLSDKDVKAALTSAIEKHEKSSAIPAH